MRRALFSLLAGFLLNAHAGAEPTPSDRPPNIILILADDQGWADLGVYGGEHVETPRLDSLAAEGVRFPQFYSAASICTPARAGLLTGRYPARFGLAQGVVFPNDGHGLPPEEITLAEVLRTAGYRTMAIGKWHLGHTPERLPTQQGFETWFGVPYSNDMASTRPTKSVADLDAAWAEHDTSSTWWNVPLMRDDVVLERPTDQRRLTTRYTDEAIGFIRRNRQKPFFLYLAHSMPHVPLFVSPERHGEDPKSAYARVIAELDESTGRILDTLKTLGLGDDTIVIYTSDNGPWLEKRHHGGRALPLSGGKMTTLEGGHRVPCLIRAPGRVEAGTIHPGFATALDLFPTLAHWAGAKLPTAQPLDGIDLGPRLGSEPQSDSPHPPYLYFTTGGTLEGLRAGAWKLLDRPGETQLFNLVEDPSELRNRFSERPLEVMRLQRLLDARRAEFVAP